MLKYRWSVGILLAIFLLGGVVHAQTASSVIAPRLLKASGTLKDSSGKPVSGIVGVTVGIYKDQEGGTPLWLETQNIETDSQGNYTALLGSTKSEGMSLDLFATTETRWVGVTVLGSEVQQPRVMLVSVPYALMAADAETLGGKPLSAFVLASPDNVSGSKVSDPTVGISSLTGTGTVNTLSKFDASGTNLVDSAVVEVGGLTGVGKTNPSFRLDVNGDIRIPNNTAIYMNDSAGVPRRAALWSGLNNVYNGDVDNTGNTSFFFLAGGSGTVAFLQNGVVKMYLNDQGNFGIGTTSPGQQLEVNGTAKATSFMFGDSTTQTSAGVRKTGDTMSGALTLPANGLVAGTNQLVISGGNVGIGTASPAQKLEVAGNLTASGAIAAASFTGSGSGLSGVVNTALSLAARTRAITYLGGCDTCSVLADADDQKLIYLNLVGSMTINSITCYSDAGTPSINIQRNAADVLASPLSCSTTGATSSAFSGAQNAMSLNDKLDFVMVSAGGVAKRVTITIAATIN